MTSTPHSQAQVSTAKTAPNNSSTPSVMTAEEAMAKFQELMAKSGKPSDTSKSRGRKGTTESDQTESVSGAKYPYVTGHCGNGAHEGKKVISGLGHLLKSCSGTYAWRFTEAKCTCWCHITAAMARRDAQAAALAAPMVIQPATTDIDVTGLLGAIMTPSRATIILPPEDELEVIPLHPIKVLEALCNSGRVSQQLVNMTASKLGATYPVETRHPVAEDRRKRGELEDNVEVVCRLWLLKLLPWDQLTTDVIALMVDAGDTPSQGAVYSVLQRWATHNWATIEKGPVRFISFSEEAHNKGISELRRLAKREADRRAKGFF
jgi:hypothetical protein